MATNHLGHFALTGRLLPLLRTAPAARVVTVSSGAYRNGTIDFDDLDWTRRPYHRVRAYADSKLANLLFMVELQARFEAVGLDARSVASHPGLAATPRQQSIGIGGVLARWLAAPIITGALPQLRAATDPTDPGGTYWGPRFGIRGGPVQLDLPLDTVSSKAARRLWGVSEELTGVRFGQSAMS